uniref:Uncharacterized protein n=1 Tax=Meloidogyne enterolobii TaxID=390850 RepID=A0A6V7THI7_MELEN|nr:unnamed protein product [Meloidogyne enterolobii]
MPSLDSLPPPATIAALNINTNNSNYYNNNRWSKLPKSPHARMELITKSRPFNVNKAESLDSNSINVAVNQQQLPRVLLRRNDYSDIGELLGQEQLTGSSQVLCHYRNISALSTTSSALRPISLLCQLGCCQHILGGCCTLEDNNGHSSSFSSSSSSSSFSSSPPSSSPTQSLVSYHWAIALLCAFIICVFASTLAMLVLYWTNRRWRNAHSRRQLMLSEKYSLGIIGSSTASQQSSGTCPGSSYGTPSLIESTTANGHIPLHFYNNHQQQNKYFRNLYTPTSPPSSLSNISPSTERHRSVGGYLIAEPPQHLLKPYQSGKCLPRHGNGGFSISPPIIDTSTANSVYNPPGDEIYFRSSF